MMNYACISFLGNIFPEKKYSNDDFFRDFPAEKDNLTFQKLGVSNRHVIPDYLTSLDLAVEAGLHFFSSASRHPSEVDLLLVLTMDGDYKFTPNNAPLVHHRLQLRNDCGAMDLRFGCSGFVYGLAVAKSLLQTLPIKNVLLLLSNTLTKVIHPGDKANRFIFGDAASVVFLERGEHPAIGEFVMGADGGMYSKIIVPHGGSRHPLTEASHELHCDEYGNQATPANFYMDGTGVFLFTIKRVPKLVEEVLKANQLTSEDVDGFVFHQTNMYLNEVLRQKCGIPPEKFFCHMESCGNTVSSSIPVVLEKFIKEGKLKKGHRVLLAGFGSGLSWSGTVITL